MHKIVSFASILLLAFVCVSCKDEDVVNNRPNTPPPNMWVDLTHSVSSVQCDPLQVQYTFRAIPHNMPAGASVYICPGENSGCVYVGDGGAPTLTWTYRNCDPGNGTNLFEARAKIITADGTYSKESQVDQVSPCLDANCQDGH